MGKIMDQLLSEAESSLSTTASTIVLDLSLFSAGYRGSSLLVKQVDHVADHSPQSSFEVMNTWNISIDLYHYYPIHVQVCLIKHRYNYLSHFIGIPQGRMERPEL